MPPAASRREAAALLACLALAFALRLRGLGAAPLWMDELATRAYLELPWSVMFGVIVWLEPTPPGYYTLIKLLAPLLAGSGDAALRMPSALAGTLAILPLALHLRRSAGPGAALAGAALASVWVGLIAYSQEARAYGLLLLACATALWLHGRLLAGAPRWPLGAALGFGLLCAAMLYVHATAVFFIGALTAKSLVAAAFRRSDAGRLATIHAVAGTVTVPLVLPWLAIVAGIAADPNSSISWMWAPSLAEGLRMVGLVLGMRDLGAAGPFVPLLLLALMAVGTVGGWRRGDADAVGNAAGFAFGILALFAVSKAVPVMLERTTLTMALLALALAAQGLLLLPRSARFLALALLLASQLHGVGLRHAARLAAGHAENWSGAVAALESAQSGEPVLILGGFDIAALPNYAPGLPRRVAVRGVVTGGDRLGSAVARSLPYADVFREEEVCALSQGGRLGFFSLGREDVAQAELAIVARSLGARGSRQEQDMAFGLVHLRRWSPPPRCAEAVAAAQ